jgi:3-hydroxyisobutyrate dehydrogenase/2-hydroxy-3-oxopropionate reductase
MANVAVVGLGAMGARIARRLLDAGNELVVWNRTPERSADLVELGAVQAATPADAARDVEVVLTMVSDPAALEAVTEGGDGIVAGLQDPATVIQMSTVAPATLSRLESVLPAGTALLDAPVLGSLAEAESGSLVIFAGGPAPLVERCTPLLSALGSVEHVGPVGAGTAAKLVANSTLFGVLGVLGEALALAEGLGLSREQAFEVLAATPLAAQAERRRPVIEAGEYPTRFELALALKDAGLIAEAATAAGVDVPLAGAARAWLADAADAGWGERDYAAVLAWILDGRGAERRSARHHVENFQRRSSY